MGREPSQPSLGALRAGVPFEVPQQLLAPRSRPTSSSLSFPSLNGASSLCALHPLQASSLCLSCVVTPSRQGAHLGVQDLLHWWAGLLSSEVGSSLRHRMYLSFPK